MTTRKSRGITGVWLRPTTRTERALQDAQEHARRAGYGLTQSWHLLLALAQEPQSFSALLLERLGVTPEDLRAEVARMEQNAQRQGERPTRPWAGADPEETTARPSSDAGPTEQAWTQSRAGLLDAARQEAQRLGDTYVGTEHLLLGLLKVEGDSDPALRSLGVTWERASDALAETRRAAVGSDAGSPVLA